MRCVKFKTGDIIKYYQRDSYIDKCKAEDIYYHRNVYLYEVIGYCNNTETGEQLIVYKAIFVDEAIGEDFSLYCTPVDVFNEPIDDPNYENPIYKFTLCSKYGD